MLAIFRRFYSDIPILFYWRLWCLYVLPIFAGRLLARNEIAVALKSKRL